MVADVPDAEDAVDELLVGGMGRLVEHDPAGAGRQDGRQLGHRLIPREPQQSVQPGGLGHQVLRLPPDLVPGNLHQGVADKAVGPSPHARPRAWMARPSSTRSAWAIVAHATGTSS